MPVPKGQKKDAATIAQLKEDYLKYFSDCPVQRYAAQYIGRNEQTIIEWKNNDESFANAVQKAEADYLRKRLLKTQASFQLERLFKDLFAERHEHTGPDGEGFVVKVITTPYAGDTNHPDGQAESGVGNPQ